LKYLILINGLNLKDVDYIWDGTNKNKAAQIGTYTWKLHFTNLFSSKKELINGHVNLLR